MKVLHIYKNYYPVPGGIEGHIRTLATEMAHSDELDISVLVTNHGRGTTREVMDGVEVVKAGQNITVARTPISLRLWHEIAHTPTDIAHLHFPYPFGEMGHLLFGRAKKTVITYHSDIVSQKRLLRLYEPFLWRILARADRVIATSPRYIDSSPYLRKFKEKCTVVPFGLDLSRFQNEPPAAAPIKERYGSPLILFVGVFRYYKGLPYLIEAMKHLNGRLLLIGKGPLEAQLRVQVRESGLEGKVHFVGEVTDTELVAYYHASDILVLPSSHRSEAFGIVEIEAMACGKPVVCTELGTGTSWVNVHEDTGLVVEPANSSALAEAIGLLLDDADLRQRLGGNARQRARSEFSKELMARRVLEVYEGIA